MQGKIVKNTMLSCILVVILSVFTCVFVFSSNLQDTMNQQAYSQTMLLVHILETSKDDPVTVLEKIKNEIYGRITFMDENGKVLYDSDYDIAQMESHADRKEIVAAIMDGIGTHQRFSATANRIMYYCAARVPDMGVIRVGVMSANLASDSIASTTPAIWIGAVIFVIAVTALSSVTTMRIVNTIERYDIETGEGEIYEELQPFVNKIKSQNDIIKRQVQSLTDEKLKLQSIFMNIKEGILVCDSHMRIAQTNNEAKRIFALDDNQTNFRKAVALPELQSAVEKALTGETVHITFDWNGRWYQTITSPNYYGGDKGAILIVLDITQQIENERNRRQFTDNVTHELKTPLTSIIGYSQLITNDIARREDVKRFVGIIEQNAENLMEMINDIMRISSLESMEGLNKVVLQLDEVVNRTVNQEKLNADAENISINTSVETVRIYADESQMYQLVNNLVSNAIKYNKPGGRVDVSLSKSDGCALLTVADTGIGIPEERIDKIFERFYVVDKSRNKKISSTGLGLSIVKHIVKAHDGTVSVKSQKGAGTEFTVKLPL